MPQVVGTPAVGRAYRLVSALSPMYYRRPGQPSVNADVNSELGPRSETASDLGAPLRNRTVDLLLTMDIRTSLARATTWVGAQLTCRFAVLSGLGLPRIAWQLSPPFVPTAGHRCVMALLRRRGEGGISFEHRGPYRDPDRHGHCPGLWRGAAVSVPSSRHSKGQSAPGDQGSRKMALPVRAQSALSPITT